MTRRHFETQVDLSGTCEYHVKCFQALLELLLKLSPCGLIVRRVCPVLWIWYPLKDIVRLIQLLEELAAFVFLDV